MIFKSLYIKSIFTFLLCLLIFKAQAQQSNTFYKVDSTETKEFIQFVFNDLSFIKNNEYFNLIADGYTLFGNKLEGAFYYQKANKYSVGLGIVALKYYGMDRFIKIIPSISLQYKQGNNRFYFGRLNTKNNHYLPKPIYSFERRLDTRSVENGIQHTYRSKHWITDTWLEWEHFIQKEDAQRERLNFGQTTTFSLPFKNGNISIPLSVLLMHRGGQINQHAPTTDLANAIVFTNACTGLIVDKYINNKVISISYQYLLHAVNAENTEEWFYKNGYAHWLQIELKTKRWQFNLAYWKAHQFVGIKGDDMYQSVSQRIEKYIDAQGNPTPIFGQYTEPDRELLTASVSYAYRLDKHLNFRFVIDGFYQLNKGEIYHPRYSVKLQNHFDYALGLYVNYTFKQRVLKLK